MRRTSQVYKIVGVFLAIGLLIVLGGASFLVWQAISQDEQAANLPTTTPTPTATNTATSTPSPTAPIPSVTVTPTYVLANEITARPTATVSLTFTATTTLTATATITPTPTHTVSPTITPTPTATFTPTLTFTPRPTITPTFTRSAGAPAPVELITSDFPITNILVVGSDRRPGQSDYRTDVMVVVSINRATGTVSMLSLPRDLYVYIPTHGYDRLNTAALWGELTDWDGGGGIGLLKETVRYNFGIRIDFYAMVNFTSFAEIIDTLDGVEIVVDCALADYRLKSPDLNPNVFANYEWIELPVGVYDMDGAEALWYARSRATTSDFDRNARHQMLLRAIWQRFQELSLWETVPQLWEDFNNLVETDMTLPDILALLPYGINLDPRMIETHFIGRNEVEDYMTPQGAAVLRLRPDAIRAVVEDFYTPPTVNRLYQENARIEIINQSGRDDLAEVAMAVLGEIGFIPILSETSEVESEDDIATESTLYDFTGDTKGSSLGVLTRVFNIAPATVVIDPDPNRTADYRIIIGTSFNSCFRAPVRG